MVATHPCSYRSTCFFLCMTATLTPSAASIIVSQNEQNEAVGEIGTGKIKLIDEYWSKERLFYMF